jgi:tetratricopeptide (TPR) repeat protein
MRPRRADPPKGVAALEPLFQAVAHGCKAGRQQETLAEVYKNRICRRWPDGKLYFHAQNSLGAIGPCLAALAWFFDKPFETPHAGLKAQDRAWVLGNAASFLGALGRLGEARDAQRSALEMRVAAKDWQNAAKVAANLAEAAWTLGDIAAAIDDAARGVDFADKSADERQMLIGRGHHAHALAVAGDIARARASFADAEARQKKLQSQIPRLYSFVGAQLCDLLLGEGRLKEVAERGAYALAIAERKNWVLAIGLDNLSLGRAALGLALSAPTPSYPAPHLVAARKHLDIAVAELRRSNIAIDLPRGPLARARLRRAEGDFAGARRDLDEVLEIAEPGPMRLHLCDRHLELCRLALAQRDGFAPLRPSPPPPATGEARDKLTQTAREELDEAAKLIKECGYHKRDAERDELSDVLAGKRLFRDLPIHV